MLSSRFVSVIAAPSMLMAIASAHTAYTAQQVVDLPARN